MNKLLKLVAPLILITPVLLSAAPLGDYTFKSPSFNGVGYSSHVLTIENQEATRQKARDDKVQSALDKAASDSKNTNLSKFLNNLESRIYAQISQNVATAMFANNSCNVASDSNCSGAVSFQGSNIAWRRVSDPDNCIGSANGTCIVLRVSDPSVKDPANALCRDVGMSCIYIPLESFNMPGN
jgi:hypothetical protein